jgi:hypothetical protein
MAAAESQWYNESQPHLLLVTGPGDSGAVGVLSPPRYAVLQLKRATVRAQTEYTMPLLVLQSSIWAILRRWSKTIHSSSLSLPANG